jgi:hypothetical protein
MRLLPNWRNKRHLEGLVNFKKTIAPVIVTLILSGYSLAIGFAFYKFPIPTSIKLTVVIASVIGTVVIIGVLIERLKEIKGGEEDDLGKY